jgi:hypothetical protein
MEMLRRIWRIIGFLMLFVVVLAPIGCNKKAQVEVLDSRLASGWLVTVLEVSQPATVDLAPRSPLGGTFPEKSSSATQGERWLLVRVNIKAPQAGAAVAADRIRLLTSSDAEIQVIAMTGASTKKKPSFTELKDSDMLGWLNAKGEMNWMVMRNEQSGQLEVVFQKTDPVEAYLLFSVPVDGRNFRLVM